MYNKANLEVAAIIDKDGRYGLVFEPGQTWATNGQALVKITAPAEKLEDFPELSGKQELTNQIQIEKEDALKIKKMIPKKICMPILKNIVFTGIENGLAKFATTDLSAATEIKARIKEGKPPDLASIYPKETPFFSICFNVDLLLNVLKIIKEAKENRSYAKKIKIDFWDKDKVARIQAKNSDTEQEIEAAIMPMKERE